MPELAEEFVSTTFGYRVAYPTGWVAQGSEEQLFLIHPLGTSIAVAAEPLPDVPLGAYVTTVAHASAAFATSFREVSRTELEEGNAYLVETEMVIGASGPLRQKVFITLNGDFVVALIGSISTNLLEVHGPLVDEMFAMFETFPPASVEDDHGDFPAQATTIEIGSSTQGVIGNTLDIDFFRFDAQAGVTYRAQVRLGSLSDSLITLLGATGSCSLASNDDIVDSLASRLTWTARESAALFLVVENADGTSAGSYTLSLQTADPSEADDHGEEACSATPMEGTSIDGLVSELGDLDAFSFEAVGGTAYVVEVVLESLEDSVLLLFDIDGLTLLADNDDFFAGSLASRISWTAPQSGTYYLGVGGGGGTGSYRLRVSPETDSSGTGGGTTYGKPGAEQRPAPAVVR